ncbi:copper-binding protein [Streptomyces rectiverticillatus]|uniref:cupredoxin domain-containing protein n=1 Tax=Streptomyces rectiverticillatus TaxID=173860 RepID=UPI0015C3803F|nr:plastocyanin/azurin family copper-binding protein [Streptomyces rectiverticillatus]QLE74624.1 copper-binding protein [Streptomyces rectiverticillatus]
MPVRSLPRLFTASLAALSLGTLLAGPAASADRSADRVRAETIVFIENSRFDPQNVTVNLGDSVRWINNHNIDHTATSDDGRTFDSGVIPVGRSFTHVFRARGTFPYHCTIHPSMRGTVTVE